MYINKIERLKGESERLDLIMVPSVYVKRASKNSIKLSPHINNRIDGPIIVIDPVPINELGGPVKSGDFLLWPEKKGNEAFFTLDSPRLQDFTMTVQREAFNETVRITGASVVFAVSVYDQVDLIAVENYRESWDSTLKAAGYEAQKHPVIEDDGTTYGGGTGSRMLPQWRFTPLHLRNLQAAVNLPQNHLKSEPKVIINNSLGTVIFMIELTEMGTQIWKEALEQHSGNMIPGACELKASYYAQLQEKIVSIEQNLSTTIGNLVKNLGPESVRVVNSELSAEVKVIVSGYPSIDSVVIELRPEKGHPISQIFGASGGQFSTLITGNDLREVEVDWFARVSYRNSGWPIVQDSGKLSLATTNSTVIVKPDIWIIEYTLLCILLDSNGNVLTKSESSDIANRIQCDLIYSAPFLSGVDSLHSTFETSSQNMSKIAFPKPPGQPAGRLKLSIFAKRGEKDSFTNRMLQPDERLVIVKIDTNAQISIVTNKDPVSESSLESGLFNLIK
ncbi:hypothetical protein ACQKM9_16980 [Viridibacillus sp. NPDC093762]|uniref:hypothetical protein n=1 Tax=Viridibacillus sp. NPDC093762 TaxID=3390720 RepID=UPI003D04DB1B